jgi:DNA-binding NarL/FixJ family response regulator
MAAGLGATREPQSPADERPVLSSLRDRANAGGALRILLAERRASAYSELSRRLRMHGHEVLARVTSAQGAIDYAGLLTPDVVLFSPTLEDAPGLTVAITVARKQPGVAAVVLTSHPAVADPASRPNWGPVALVPADAESDDLHAELWRAVARAREAAGLVHFDPEEIIPDNASDIMVLEPDVDVVIRYVPEPAPQAPLDPAAAEAAEAQAIAEMVDALYPAPSTLVPSTRVPLEVATDTGQSDTDVVERAASTLVERARLSRTTAMALMEEEAADTGQSVADVARAMLGEDSDGGTTGGKVAEAA